MLSLAIHHNLWLTRDQRYAVHNGIELVIVGVSVPVWVANQKSTSEPAQEIFCKYNLKNTKINEPIKINKDGYEITLPYQEGTLPSLTDEEWRELNATNPSKLDEVYSKCKKSVCSKNLLDLKDGGCKCLSFREHNKMKNDNEIINFIHFVNIMDMEELTKSLI